VVGSMKLRKNECKSVIKLCDEQNWVNCVRFDELLYVGMSRFENGGRSHRIKIDSSSFKRVEQFKYLGIAYSGRN